MVKLDKALLGGGLILLIAFNLYSFLNFMFHFSMARMLSVADYGVLASLYSFIYILGFFSDSIQTVITKYSSSESDSSRIKNLLKKSLSLAVKSSGVLFIIYIIASIIAAPLLHIPYSLMALNGLMILTSFLTPITRGVLQGKKKFMALGLNMISESATKFVLSIILVFIGFKVYGAILATIIGVSISLFFSFIALRQIFRADEKPARTTGIYDYSAPVFLTILSVTLFFSLDIIIAKAVFDSQTAGFYSIASMLAKTIFLGVQPLSKAMFSLSAEKANLQKKGKDKHQIILNALGMTLACLIPALIVFYLFPDLLVRIFSGRYIVESASILFSLAIGTSILSIVNTLLLYKLSITQLSSNFKHSLRNYIPLLLPLVFVVIQTILLIVFSSSLHQFAIAYITSAAIFLWGSIMLLDR